MDNKTYRINYYKNNLNLHGGYLTFKEILEKHFPSNLVRVNILGSTIDEIKLNKYLNEKDDKNLKVYLHDLRTYENKKNPKKHKELKNKLIKIISDIIEGRIKEKISMINDANEKSFISASQKLISYLINKEISWVSDRDITSYQTNNNLNDHLSLQNDLYEKVHYEAGHNFKKINLLLRQEIWEGNFEEKINDSKNNAKFYCTKDTGPHKICLVDIFDLYIKKAAKDLPPFYGYFNLDARKQIEFKESLSINLDARKQIEFKESLSINLKIFELDNNLFINYIKDANLYGEETESGIKYLKTNLTNNYRKFGDISKTIDTTFDILYLCNLLYDPFNIDNIYKPVNDRISSEVVIKYLKQIIETIEERLGNDNFVNLKEDINDEDIVVKEFLNKNYENTYEDRKKIVDFIFNKLSIESDGLKIKINEEKIIISLPKTQNLTQHQNLPVVQTVVQPVLQPVPQPVLQPVPQPVLQPVPQPVLQPVLQPVPQHVLQPVPQPVPQRVIKIPIVYNN